MKMKNKKKKIFLYLFLSIFLLSFVYASLTLSSNPYVSTNINVTNESNFAHINTTDDTLKMYTPLDINFGVTNRVTGKYGNAFDFDGTNDFIKVDDLMNALLPSNTGTISFWMNATDPTPASSRTILSFGYANNNERLSIWINPTGQLNAIAQNSAGQRWRVLTTNAVSGGWHHVTLVQDAVSPVIYIDGVQPAQYFTTTTDKTFWFNDFSNLNSGRIGEENYNTLHDVMWDGLIDEMYFFNRTLNSTEIASLNNSNTVLNSTGLVSHYGFDSSTTNTVSDTISNNDGYANVQDTIYDYTLNSYDLTPLGATYNTSGKYGGSYYFNGATDYFERNGAFQSSDQVGTISAWIKPESENNNYIFSYGETIISNYGMLGFRIYSPASTVYLGMATKPQGDTTWDIIRGSTPILVDGSTWYHVVVTSDGSTWKMYVNGNVETLTVVAGVNKGEWIGDLGFTASKKITIGNRYYGGSYLGHFNGTIDDFMYFNRTLNSTEVSNIYNKQYSRFYPTGEMLFQNNNFGTNDTLNITLDSCQIKLNSRLRAKVNSGSWKNFSNCVLTNYSMTGNLTNANITIGFVAGNESNSTTFYSPNIIKNITLSSYSSGESNPPTISGIISPLNQTYSISSILFRLKATDDTNISSCWYSIDGGITNQTLIREGISDYYNYTNSSISDGTYTSQFYCNDTYNNLNDTESVVFTIDTTSPTITIDNPQLNIDENANPVLFRILTNEASTCDISIDGGNNLSTTTTNNLTHLNNQTMSDGIHNVIAYCNDTVGNQGVSSTRNFNVYLSNGGSGNIGANGNPILQPQVNITLYKMNFSTTQELFYYDFDNILKIETFDNNGTHVEVDNINVNLENNLNNNVIILRKDVGIYEAKININDITNETLIFNITSNQGVKNLQGEFSINISNKGLFQGAEEIKNKYEKQLIAFFNNNWTFILWGLIFLIVLIILTIIIKEIRENKNSKLN